MTDRELAEKLPIYNDIEVKDEQGIKLTALELFILDAEPGGPADIEWRKQLLEAVKFVEAKTVAELSAKAVPGDVSDFITVWKDGTYKEWRPLDAEYAANDPNWLVNIDLRPILATLQAQIATARAINSELYDETFVLEFGQFCKDRGGWWGTPIEHLLELFKKERFLITTPAPEKENGNG